MRQNFAKRNKGWFTTYTLVVVLLALAVLGPSQLHTRATGGPTESSVGSQAGSEPGMENFDIRTNSSQEARIAMEQYRQAMSQRQRANLANIRDEMANAQPAMARNIPGLRVEFSSLMDVPEIVGTESANFLTAPSTDAREGIVRSFLSANKSLYGLTTDQVAQLKTIADYTNPAGNLSWVELQQEINGIPVFQGELRAALTRNGEIARIVGLLLPGLNYGEMAIIPGMSAANGVRAGAEAIGMKIDANALNLKSAAADGKSFNFEPGPFAGDIKIELRYFPLAEGVAVLAYSMILWQENPAYYILVDAGTGQLLFRKNIVNEQTQTATYAVYHSDSPGPLSPTNATPGSGIQGPGIGRANFTLISEGPAFNNLGWITDGGNTTTGNNVDAGLDLDFPPGIDPNGRPVGTPFRVFNFPYNPPPLGTDPPTGFNYRSGEVTNMFFWSNRYHDRLYQLGFTEVARNFQTNNFGRGGFGDDHVLAEAQDYSGTNNANFATPPDGISGRMQMYIFTGPDPDRSSGLDQQIIIHELTHGTSNRLHANASGLTADQSRGMGEGWSDFYARALLSTAGENINGVYPIGAYSLLHATPGYTDNYYYGARRFPYAVRTTVGPNGRPHNPLTFADIDQSRIDLTDGAYPHWPTSSTLHQIGEVWCMALLEVRARLIKYQLKSSLTLWQSFKPEAPAEYAALT